VIEATPAALSGREGAAEEDGDEDGEDDDDE
jgi:hypothetical protein